jgi:hypothetical protein
MVLLNGRKQNYKMSDTKMMFFSSLNSMCQRKYMLYLLGVRGSTCFFSNPFSLWQWGNLSGVAKQKWLINTLF